MDRSNTARVWAAVLLLGLPSCALPQNDSEAAWRPFQAGAPAASAGGIPPMGSSRRRLLNQSTHSSVANSTASRLRQGRRITSVLYRPLIVLARALYRLRR